jgi:hypothetical protein
MGDSLLNTMRTGMIYGRARVEDVYLDLLVQKLKREHPSFRGRRVIYERPRRQDGEGRKDEVGAGIGCIPEVRIVKAFKELQRLSRATGLDFTRKMTIQNRLEGITDSWFLQNDSHGLELNCPYVVEVWMTSQMSGADELSAMREYADLVIFSVENIDGSHILGIPRQKRELTLQGSFPRTIASKGFLRPDPRAFLQFYDQILDFEKPRHVDSPQPYMLIHSQTYHRGGVLIATCPYPKMDLNLLVIEGRR